ncbi:envelope-like protein, partial [Trifolium pratense]
MAGASSSSTSKIPPFMFRNLQLVGNEMEFPESELIFLSEKMVDFDSLQANGFDVKKYFSTQGWDKYFDMLNGPIYPDLLKKFWMKAKVFDKFEAQKEERAAIERDPSLKGKTRKEMGLLEFTGTQIRSNICGLNMAFSPIHFNALLGLPNSGIELDVFEKDTRYRDDLLHLICTDLKLKGKVKGLTDECRVLFKIILAAISPRVGGTDTISWTHRHLLYFLLKGKKVNLGEYFFERICEAIFSSKSQRKTTIVYPRLLSDLLYQGHVVQNLKKFYPELVEKKFTLEILNASFLTKMRLISTKLVSPPQEFSARLEDRLYVDGYPVISEMDVEHIIQDYLEVLRKEGFTVDRSMIPPAPVNMYNPTRRPKRKADSQVEQPKPDLLAQKKIKVEQSVAEQRTNKKREDVANKAAEGSSKEPIVVEVDSSSDETESEDETESDEETIGAKLRRRQVPDPKGKSSKFVFNEAEVGIGFTKPLRTILPEPANISTSDNPLSELEKHLSPDPLNNQTFNPKSSSPPKPKSPPTQPQIESSTIPSSEPEPNTPATEQVSPTKQPSPIKSPELTSTHKSPEHSSPNSTPEPQPNPSAEHASPERIHTCAPKPSEAEVVIIDNPANKSPNLPTIPNISPSSSDPFGNLSTQLYDDLLRLSQIKDKFLDGLARAGLKRLTSYSHEEYERAKLEAITATAQRLSAFKVCWIDSKLFQSLENQRVENEPSVARRTRSRACKGVETANTPVQPPKPSKDTGKKPLYGPPKPVSKVVPRTETKKTKAPPNSDSDFEPETDVAASGSTSRKSIGRKKVPQTVPYAPLDNVSFHLENGSARWKFVYHRRLALERNLKADILECSSIVEALEYAGLMKIVVGLDKCYDRLVKEFLINVADNCNDPASPEYRQGFVRGKCVKFSPTVINQHLQRNSDEVAPLKVTDNEVCKVLTGGRIKVWPSKAKLAATSLSPFYAVLNR